MVRRQRARAGAVHYGDVIALHWLIVAFYGIFALVALLNLLFMTRPGRSIEGPTPLILIPARNEAGNLTRLLPVLISQVGPHNVAVFDDESEDETRAVAKSLGVHVLTPRETLPLGWTGKNRACFELARFAASTEAEWWLFLDADVRPLPEFILGVRWLCNHVPKAVGMITGFPRILAGRGIEPLFLAWVGWVLLATNPYGLVSLTRRGHNRFKNGQVHCWRREVYLRLQPNERVKSQIMEDVMIGRLLANEGVAVEVANLNRLLEVRMYEHWRETFDGMSKNSYEIAGSVGGSLAIAAFFMACGWVWLLAGPLWPAAYALMLLSGVFVCLVARACFWPLIVAPLVPTVGAITVVRSTIWHRRGTVKWKGRVYDARTLKK